MKVRSPQTSSENDRRLVAAWAADCAERVLGLFEAEVPGDDGPRAAIARARAFASPSGRGFSRRVSSAPSSALQANLADPEPQEELPCS
jgi:hypothetical protein